MWASVILVNILVYPHSEIIIGWLYGIWSLIALVIAGIFAIPAASVAITLSRGQHPSSEAWLCLGIFLSWLGSGLHRGWFWLARALDRPDWLNGDSWLIQIPTLIFLSGAIVHLSTGLTTIGARKYWPLIVIGLASAPMGAQELLSP